MVVLPAAELDASSYHIDGRASFQQTEVVREVMSQRKQYNRIPIHFMIVLKLPIYWQFQNNLKLYEVMCTTIYSHGRRTVSSLPPELRENQKDKACEVVFTCATIHPPHLENHSGFIIRNVFTAHRRFAGQPRIIIPENGTSFIGAEGELKRHLKVEGKNSKILPSLAKCRVSKFNTPPGLIRKNF